MEYASVITRVCAEGYSPEDAQNALQMAKSFLSKNGQCNLIALDNLVATTLDFLKRREQEIQQNIAHNQQITNDILSTISKWPETVRIEPISRNTAPSVQELRNKVAQIVRQKQSEWSSHYEKHRAGYDRIEHILSGHCPNITAEWEAR